MLLIVKPLQGTECNLQVSENEKISTVKTLVAEKLDIPVGQQRLLYKGKALSDEHRLSDYSIGPDSKLNLVVKQPEKSLPEDTLNKVMPQQPSIWSQVSEVLAKHFTQQDAEKVLEQLQKDYERSLRHLSLDDIERLATRILHPEMAESMDVGFFD
ncbi:ubiquitin-like protein 4A [Protopterus annectens]|uniref:ubiquitin-like protein 4A n=1 Tax=Protopterus annectens TaxID=7888 RepID=UPI001CFAAEF2|nr:ubiquitin-like protein 4A [Protopterus annectens]